MTEQVQLALIIATPPTIAAIASVIVSLANQSKLHKLHQQVNSRLDQLLAASKAISHSEGMQAQRTLDDEKLKKS